MDYTPIPHFDGFPHITHLDDVWPHVAENPAIRKFVNGPFTIVRYLINDSDFFKTPWDMECRGLVFDSATGSLLCRPLHKFFNLLVVQHLDDLLQRGDLTFEDKLDGSMIFTCVHHDTLHFFTKGGDTLHARQAAERAPENIHALARDAARQNLTPIFEHVGPENRIVLAYEKEEFVLLAVRDIHTGAYSTQLADQLAGVHGVRRPDIRATIRAQTDLREAVATIAQQDDIEGVVAVAPDGNRIKIKSRSYLQIHKTVSMMGVERHVLHAILGDIQDDIYPLLRPEQRAVLHAYEKEVNAWISDTIQRAQDAADRHANLSGRDKAMAIQRDNTPSWQRFVFMADKGKLNAESARKVFAQSLRTQSDIENARAQHPVPVWAPPANLFLSD